MFAYYTALHCVWPHIVRQQVNWQADVEASGIEEEAFKLFFSSFDLDEKYNWVVWLQILSKFGNNQRSRKQRNKCELPHMTGHKATAKEREMYEGNVSYSGIFSILIHDDQIRL